jgi:hypothetical protein
LNTTNIKIEYANHKVHVTIKPIPSFKERSFDLHVLLLESFLDITISAIDNATKNIAIIILNILVIIIIIYKNKLIILINNSN